MRAGLLPSGQVRMWLNGEWADALLFGFELHGEPVRTRKHKPQVEAWLLESIDASHEGDVDRAEGMLKKALAVEPDQTDLQNNLAALYAATGRESQAQEIW